MFILNKYANYSEWSLNGNGIFIIDVIVDFMKYYD